mmetsp:Transcript_109529/g.194212  ORF Transcript_109529/g.194212 Transcript_109529/m.194212 type:complete len:239 (-) Transcript_109529:507-1223(-)
MCIPDLPRSSNGALESKAKENHFHLHARTVTVHTERLATLTMDESHAPLPRTEAQESVLTAALHDEHCVAHSRDSPIGCAAPLSLEDAHLHEISSIRRGVICQIANACSACFCTASCSIAGSAGGGSGYHIVVFATQGIKLPQQDTHLAQELIRQHSRCTWQRLRDWYPLTAYSTRWRLCIASFWRPRSQARRRRRRGGPRSCTARTRPGGSIARWGTRRRVGGAICAISRSLAALTG